MLCLVGLNLATSWAFGGLTFYTSEAALNAASPVTLLDDYSSGIPLNVPLASFVSHGVTYTGYAGEPFPNVWDASPGYNNFGAGVGTTTSYIITANGDEDFTADFSTPYHAVGFDAYLNGLGPLSVKVYDAATLLGTFNFSPTANDEEYLGFVSTAPITSFRWTSTDGGVLNTGIGDLSVSAAVPDVASTISILGIALTGLSGVRRFWR
jgi:hypothetical protein